MFSTENIKNDDAYCFMNGGPLEKFIPTYPEFRTYIEFVEKRLMAPLTPVRYKGKNVIQKEDTRTYTEKHGYPPSHPTWAFQ